MLSMRCGATHATHSTPGVKLECNTSAFGASPRSRNHTEVTMGAQKQHDYVKNNPSIQPSARNTEEGDRFNRTLFSALDALEAKRIPYALIGGVAASGLGRPRSTHDI